MADKVTWEHYKTIIGLNERIEDSIKQIVRDVDRLKAIKEAVFDNPELRTKLKEIVDVDDDRTMESLVADYQRFQSLRAWLEENEF